MRKNLVHTKSKIIKAYGMFEPTFLSVEMRALNLPVAFPYYVNIILNLILVF